MIMNYGKNRGVFSSLFAIARADREENVAWSHVRGSHTRRKNLSRFRNPLIPNPSCSRLHVSVYTALLFKTMFPTHLLKLHNVQKNFLRSHRDKKKRGERERAVKHELTGIKERGRDGG